MRILYILPFVPWPIKVRSYNLIPRLARRNEIHLLALARSQEEEERLHNVARHCASATVIAHSSSRGVLNCVRALPTPVPFRIAYFRSREMREAAQRLACMLSPDVIYLERWRTLQYVAGI